MEKEDKIKIISAPDKKSKRFSFHFSYKMGDDPDIDWALILIIGTIIAGLGIVSGYFSYSNLDENIKATNARMGSASSQMVSIYDTNKLKSLVGLMNERKDRDAEYRAKYVGVIDPSL